MIFLLHNLNYDLRHSYRPKHVIILFFRKNPSLKIASKICFRIDHYLIILFCSLSIDHSIIVFFLFCYIQIKRLFRIFLRMIQNVCNIYLSCLLKGKSTVVVYFKCSIASINIGYVKLLLSWTVFRGDDSSLNLIIVNQKDPGLFVGRFFSISVFLGLSFSRSQFLLSLGFFSVSVFSQSTGV